MLDLLISLKRTICSITLKPEYFHFHFTWNPLMGPNWPQESSISLAWNRSPSVVSLVSSLPLSAFSLMNKAPAEAYHSQFLEEARLYLPLELHLLGILYLGSPPLLVHLIAPIHWIRLHEIFPSTLHKEKSSDQALLPVPLSTLRLPIGPGSWLLLKLHFPPLFPFFTLDTGLLADPPNSHSHFPWVKKCFPRYLWCVPNLVQLCSKVTSSKRLCLTTWTTEISPFLIFLNSYPLSTSVS